MVTLMEEVGIDFRYTHGEEFIAMKIETTTGPVFSFSDGPPPPTVLRIL